MRETFCRTACPYGLLQGVIEDGRSLHVRFDATPGACIDCGACARACPMDIDIRKGSFQIECTRCGSCIDSCDAVLSRLKPARPGLLRFDFAAFSWRVWDLKRALVALATAGFALATLMLSTPAAIVLFFVYPLKFLFTMVVDSLLGFTEGQQMIEPSQGPMLMAIYGAGFIAVQLVFVALYWRAYALRRDLDLNARETWITRSEIQSFSLNILVGVTSVGVALVGGEAWIAWSGWSYVMIWPLQAFNARFMRSRWDKREDNGAT